MRETIHYGPEVWRGGSRGHLDRWVTPLPRLVNLQVYRSGMLGPRPGWKHQSTYETSASGVNTAGRRGAAFIFYEDPQTSFTEMILALENPDNTSLDKFHQASLAGYTPASGGSWLATKWGPLDDKLDIVDAPYGGSVDSPPTSIARYGHTSTGASYAKTHRFQHRSYRWTVDSSGVSGGTLLDPTHSHSAHSASYKFQWPKVERARIHQSRMLHYANPEYPRRIAYSDPVDFSGYSSAAQYFDLDHEVIGSVSVGSSLYLWCRTNDWYVLQGRGNPADGTLTYLGKGPAPRGDGFYAMDQDVCYFLDPARNGLVAVSQQGIETNNVSHLANPDSFDYPLRAVASARRNALILPNYCTDNYIRGIERINDVWTEVDYGPDGVYPEMTAVATSDRGGYVDMDVDEDRGVLWMVQGWYRGNDRGAAAADRADRYRIWTRDICLDAPPIVGSYSQVVDGIKANSAGTLDAAGYFTNLVEFPPIKAASVQQTVRVLTAHIELAVWVGGSYQTPAFTIVAVGPDGTEYPMATDLTSKLVGVTGTPSYIRVRAFAAAPPALPHAFLRVKNMVSCAVREVTVEVEAGKEFV